MQALEGRGFVETLALVTGMCVALTASGVLAGYFAEWGARRLRRVIFAVPLKRNQLRTEILGTVLFHVVFCPPLAWAIHAGWVHFESNGLVAAVFTFGACWFVFQWLYYGAHRAMHHRALFWMHRWHHESLVTTPWTGLSMSPFEASFWVFALVAPAIALSSLGMLSGLGWAVFLIIHWVGNVAGHANAEFFPYRATRLSALLFPPVSYHALHHARFDRHHAFAGAYMDRLFGTEYEDWKAVHDRVFDGTPLHSLRERG